jgi:serine/threonine protein kinase
MFRAMSEAEPRQYRVLEVLGRGGFGTVYRAELRLPGGFVKDVALKVLDAEAEGDPERLARLRDEARLLGLVRHRALVGVDGLVRLFDRWTVVMEYVSGASLQRLLDVVGPLPIPVALQVVEEVASGLHAAYTAIDKDDRPIRLLHRDVKPSNVQVSRLGEVKLLDFGIARGDFGARETESASIVYGSLPYVAPERLDLQDMHESDVFSLVVTLAQLATGGRPPAVSADPVKHAARIEETGAQVRRAGGSDELVALIRRGLAWEPADRPDARELERQCRALRASLPDVHLADWAETEVARVEQAREVQKGPFSGMLVAEAATTESHRHLADLLGVAIPTTFDDPVTTEAEPTAEVPPPEPTPVPPTPSRPAPPPRRRGRWLTALGLVVLALAALVAVGLLGAMLGSGAIVGGLVLAIQSDGVQSCLSAVRSTHQTLESEGPRGLAEAEPFFDAALERCRDGRLGWLGAVGLMAVAQKAGQDGEIAADELRELNDDLLHLTEP